MTFTASQIAAALGVTPQAVRKQLRGIVPSGEAECSGVKTSAWAVTQFPTQLQARLKENAQRRKYRTIEALLLDFARQWHPPFPLNEICDDDTQSAVKLKFSMQPWLERQHDPNLSNSEMEASGVRDYEKYFGHNITPRYWRELFNRCVQRDNSAQNWNRVEIYLPEKCRRKNDSSAPGIQAADDFAEITDFICACGNPESPTETERRGIWARAFDRLEALVSQGESEKSASRRVREFLFVSAPFLSPSRNSLWMAFERKLDRWRAANCNAAALRDGRAENGPCFKLPENDRDLLIHRAVFHYRGDISTAWRDLLRNKLFSADTVSLYASQAQSKSHVPTSIRESVAPEVDILTTLHQGQRAFDAITGHVTRSYDGIHSLQCISGDDFTLNTYFYVPDGNGWFNLTRGQVILFIDFRSLRILGWALEPRKSYSSLTIRSLCTQVFGEFGVPEVLYFERGLWKSSTLLKGKTDAVGFTEISQGLREFGIKFIHAIRPRTKVVERIGGMFQDIAEAEPGYCGRDERRDAPESLRKQMAEVESRKAHPSKYFYSLDQWNRRIGQLIESYNSDPQQGRILDGMSPDQAFQAHMDQNNPPLQFGAELRYLLAHDKRIALMTTNGVTIQVGKQKFNYCGREIAHLVGRQVLAWFDPENPETLVVTDMDRKNPICVARSQDVGALELLTNPDGGNLSEELARKQAQVSYMKTRFNIIKAKFPLPSRALLNAAQAVELGVEIIAQKASVAEKQSRQIRQRSQARQFAQRTGIVIPERAQSKVDPNRLRELEEFLKGNDEPSVSPSLTKKNGQITYNLKPFKGGKAKQ